MNNFFKQFYNFLYKKFLEWKKYLKLQRQISSQSFKDFVDDFKNMKVEYIIYDITGIIGFTLVILSYILTLIYFIRKHRILGMPLLYFYLRFAGIIMTFTYAYLRNNLAMGVAIAAITSISTISFLHVFASRAHKVLTT